MTYLNPEALLARYDAVRRQHARLRREEHGAHRPYGQLTRIIGRLRDPLFLSENTRRMYGADSTGEPRGNVRRGSPARRSRVSTRWLNWGILNRETLLPVIDAVGALQDAAMTGYCSSYSVLLRVAASISSCEGGYRTPLGKRKKRADTASVVDAAGGRGESNGANCEHERRREDETRIRGQSGPRTQ